MHLAPKVRIPLPEADVLAAEVLELLRPACTRLAVAGSIRRRRPDVGDLEVVAIPRYESRLQSAQVGLFEYFSLPPIEVNLLDERCAGLLLDGTFAKRLDKHGRPAVGERYKRLTFHDFGLDLFITTPPQFGVILTIRTGPAEYSHRLVTSTREGGLLPAWLQVQDGALRHRSTGEVIPTPTEESFYAAIQQPYLEPWRRR